MDTSVLVSTYYDELKMYIERVHNEGGSAIPRILARITTVILPAMMVKVGEVKTLSGREKKQMVEDSILSLVDTIFKHLDESYFKDDIWDNQVRNVIMLVLPSMIDMLIDIEKGKLKFNKRMFKCC